MLFFKGREPEDVRLEYLTLCLMLYSTRSSVLSLKGRSPGFGAERGIENLMKHALS